MPFQEKSAWVMSLALLACSLFYALVVWRMSADAGALVPPMLPTLIAFTVLLAVIAVAMHIVAAVLTPKEANRALDERERQIAHRAGHISGLVFATGVALGLGYYLLAYDGDVLFYMVFGTWVSSQLVEYWTQIYLYRWGH